MAIAEHAAFSEGSDSPPAVSFETRGAGVWRGRRVATQSIGGSESRDGDRRVWLVARRRSQAPSSVGKLYVPIQLLPQPISWQVQESRPVDVPGRGL